MCKNLMGERVGNRYGGRKDYDKETELLAKCFSYEFVFCLEMYLNK